MDNNIDKNNLDGGNSQFNYTYTALTESERRNVLSIRNEYEPTCGKKSKLARLQELDKNAKTFPKAFSVVAGIIGVLVMGLGMSMVMVWDMLGWGIAIGSVGVAMLIVAYPIYKVVLKWSKNKVSSEVLSLSNDLLEDISINEKLK